MNKSNSFTAGFFAGNRQRLREAISEQLIIMTANGLLQRSGDTTYPFRQDSNFWYLTGINEPDVVLVMDGDHEYLLVPGRSTVREAFDGAIEASRLTEISGIAEIVEEEKGWQHLGTRIQKAKSLATALPAKRYLDQYGFYSNPSRARLHKRMLSFNTNISLTDIRGDLAVLRMVKQAPEIAAMRRAIEITSEALTELRGQLGGYSYEYEIEAAVTQGFRSRGAQGHAYTPIVASGKNACTLHYTANDAKLEPGGLLLMDVGAEHYQYAADITRTYALREPSPRQLEVYEAVCRVQDYAYSLLTPGITIREYESKVEPFMGKQLKQLGLIKRQEREDIRRFYPHMTSHFLGLDVHDVGDYDRKLEPGMALTVEPGIYIADEGIGVRIEDNVLITDTGAEVLSADLPRDLM